MTDLLGRIKQMPSARRWRGRARMGRTGWRSNGVHILTYHGVVRRRTDPVLERNFHTVDQFAAHLDELARCRVVPLRDAQGVPRDRPTVRPTVALTFDDGYANNLLAAEMLAERRLPWTIFPSTGLVGRPESIWTVDVSLLMLQGEATAVELVGRHWPLGDRTQREASFQGLRGLLKALAQDEREQALADLRAQFPDGESARLVDEFDSFRMLEWADLQRLAAAGVEIGSHGVVHELQHEGQPRAVLADEVTRSRLDIETHIGVAPESFAYPNGDHCGASMEVLRDAGYRLAVTTEVGSARAAANPYALPRINAPGALPAFVGALYS